MSGEQRSAGVESKSSTPSKIRGLRQRGRAHMQDDVPSRRIGEDLSFCVPLGNKKRGSRRNMESDSTLASQPLENPSNMSTFSASNDQTDDLSGPKIIDSCNSRNKPIHLGDRKNCGRLKFKMEGDKKNLSEKISARNGAGRIFAKTLVGLGKPTSNKVSQHAVPNDSIKMSKTALENLPWEVLSIDDIAKELANPLYKDSLLLNNQEGMCDENSHNKGKETPRVPIGSDKKEPDSKGQDSHVVGIENIINGKAKPHSSTGPGVEDVQSSDYSKHDFTNGLKSKLQTQYDLKTDVSAMFQPISKGQYFSRTEKLPFFSNGAETQDNLNKETKSKSHSSKKSRKLPPKTVLENSLAQKNGSALVNDDWNDENCHIKEHFMSTYYVDENKQQQSVMADGLINNSVHLQTQLKQASKRNFGDRPALKEKKETNTYSKEGMREDRNDRRTDKGQKKKRKSKKSIIERSRTTHNRRLSGDKLEDRTSNTNTTNRCAEGTGNKEVFIPPVSIEEVEDWNKDHYCLQIENCDLPKEHESYIEQMCIQPQPNEMDTNDISIAMNQKDDLNILNKVTIIPAAGLKCSGPIGHLMDESSSESEDYDYLIFSQEDEILEMKKTPLHFTQWSSQVEEATFYNNGMDKKAKLLSQEFNQESDAPCNLSCEVACPTNPASLILNPEFVEDCLPSNLDMSDDSDSECFTFSTDCPYGRMPESSEHLSYFEQHQMKMRPPLPVVPCLLAGKTCTDKTVNRSSLILPPPIGCPVQFQLGSVFGQMPTEAEKSGQVNKDDVNAGTLASAHAVSNSPVDVNKMEISTERTPPKLPPQSTPNKPPIPPYPSAAKELNREDLNNNMVVELHDNGVHIPKPKSLASPGLLGKSAAENVRLLTQTMKQRVEESRRRTQELQKINTKKHCSPTSAESGQSVFNLNSSFSRIEKESQIRSNYSVENVMQCSPKYAGNKLRLDASSESKEYKVCSVDASPALEQINCSYSESPEKESHGIDPRCIVEKGRNAKIREAAPALPDSPTCWVSTNPPKNIRAMTPLAGISPIIHDEKTPPSLMSRFPTSTPLIEKDEDIKQKEHPRKIMKLIQDEGPGLCKGKRVMIPTRDKNSILRPWREMGSAEKERATFNAQFMPDGCSSESSPAASPERKVFPHIMHDTSSHTVSICAPSEQSYNSSYSFDTSHSSPSVAEMKPNARRKSESERLSKSPIQPGQVYDWFEDKPVSNQASSSVPRSHASTVRSPIMEQLKVAECEYGGAYSSAYSDGVNPRFQRLQQVKTRLNTYSRSAAEIDKDPLACVRWTSWQEKFLQRYQTCKVPFIDTHCHLDFLYDRTGFAGTYQKYRALNKGTFPHNYMGCVAVFCNPRTFNSSGGLWKDILMEDNVWGAIGCHPKCATDFTPMYEEEMIKMLQHEKVAAVGEIGLDFSGSFYKHHETQKNVFARQLKIAVNLEKPIVIHCRDAEQECVAVLEETIPNTHQIHRHCFTGTWDEAEAWLTKFPSSFIGLTPLITYKGNRSNGPREVAARIPLDRLLLETDAPYFVPRQIPRDAVQFSHPGMAITVAEEVAFLKGLPIDTVLEQCIYNSRIMYRLL